MPDKWIPCLCWIGAALALVALLLIVAACAPRLEYRPTPAWLVPSRPVLPVISAAELTCLSDGTYIQLATRDRLRAQYEAELMALLGGE